MLRRLHQRFLVRRVVVTVVGADEQIIFPDEFGQVGDIFIGFASDVDAVARNPSNLWTGLCRGWKKAA